MFIIFKFIPKITRVWVFANAQTIVTIYVQNHELEFNIMTGMKSKPLIAIMPSNSISTLGYFFL